MQWEAENVEEHYCCVGGVIGLQKNNVGGKCPNNIPNAVFSSHDYISQGF